MDVKTLQRRLDAAEDALRAHGLRYCVGCGGYARLGPDEACADCEKQFALEQEDEQLKQKEYENRG